MNDEWKAFFDTYNVRVGTSLDGPEAVHDSQRIFTSKRKTYAQVQSKVKKYNLPTLPTVTKHSLDYWQQIIDEQLSKGRYTVAFQKVYTINSAKNNWAEVGMSEETFLEHYDQVVEY